MTPSIIGEFALVTTAKNTVNTINFKKCKFLTMI
jgi:hypothetical protein